MRIKNHLRNSVTSSTSRGLISGIIGGLAGALLKSLLEEVLPVRKIDDRSAQIKIVDDLSTKLTGTPISAEFEGLAEQLVIIPAGAIVGATYGFGKKDEDHLNITDGMMLGATTWFSTHETSFPLLGYESKPTDVSLITQANELFVHVVFGVTTEVVRSMVNERLKSRFNLLRS